MTECVFCKKDIQGCTSLSSGGHPMCSGCALLHSGFLKAWGFPASAILPSSVVLSSDPDPSLGDDWVIPETDPGPEPLTIPPWQGSAGTTCIHCGQYALCDERSIYGVTEYTCNACGALWSQDATNPSYIKLIDHRGGEWLYLFQNGKWRHVNSP